MRGVTSLVIEAPASSDPGGENASPNLYGPVGCRVIEVLPPGDPGGENVPPNLYGPVGCRVIEVLPPGDPGCLSASPNVCAPVGCFALRRVLSKVLSRGSSGPETGKSYVDGREIGIGVGGGDCGVFGTNVDPRTDGGITGGKPRADVETGGILPDGCEPVFWFEGKDRVDVPNEPGKRIARPQRVQGLLLASHSFPQRGQIMMYSSCCLSRSIAWSAGQKTGSVTPRNTLP